MNNEVNRAHAAKKVGVIMGSASDLPVMQAAIDTLESFGIEVDKRVISAHRAPHALMERGWSSHLSCGHLLLLTIIIFLGSVL